jgi:hypothetical protein
MKRTFIIVGAVLIATACGTNQIATVVIDPNRNSSTTAPATAADAAAFYEAYIAPQVRAQVTAEIKSAITASEQRQWQTWQPVLDNLRSDMAGKTRDLEIGSLQRGIAALQARLKELNQP